MKRYEIVSGAFFTLLALLQLVRVVLGWQVRVDGVQVPLWPSLLAVVIAGAFAVWGFRSAARQSHPVAGT